MNKSEQNITYPFNVVSDEVFDLLTVSERKQIIENEQNVIHFYQENDPTAHVFTLEDQVNLTAYTRLTFFRNRQKIIQIYAHNYKENIHSLELLQEVIQKIQIFYQNEEWVAIHLNLPVGFVPEKLNEKLAHIHCRYFLGRVQYFPIQLPENYSIRIPTHSFDLVDIFETMNRKFKQKNPQAEVWEDTLLFDYWLNFGKCAVVYDAKNHPVAGIFMTYVKEFVFHYPTWQIQFVITNSAHQGKGLAKVLRKFASNMALAHPSQVDLIGGIVGLWNTPSFKNFDANGRLPCLDRILIDRSEAIGYPRAELA